MQGYYYVNDRAQVNGNHEVHIGSCFWLGLATKKTSLGYFYNCKDAVAKAKTIYSKVDGCKYCCPECHNS